MIKKAALAALLLSYSWMQHPAADTLVDRITWDCRQ